MLFAEAHGMAPRRGIWASDLSRLGDILPCGDEGMEAAAREALERASQKLGIPLAGPDLFIDAALRLKDARGSATGS